MNSHTPGPWTVQQVETNHHGYDWPTFAIRSPQNCCIAVVGEVDRYHAEQYKATALLISAAPDLLDALTRLLDLETRYTNIGLTEFDTARAAIRKAKGETE